MPRASVTLAHRVPQVFPAPAGPSDSGPVFIMAQVSQWKTIVFTSDELQLLLVAQLGNNEVRLCPGEMHDALRNIRLSRWLIKKRGGRRVADLAKRLCPTLSCNWSPSEQMRQLKRKRGEQEQPSSCFIMASITWNFMYLLLAATQKEANRARGRSGKHKKKCVKLKGTHNQRQMLRKQRSECCYH